jgi:hypothetical protein
MAFGSHSTETGRGSNVSAKPTTDPRK